MLRNEDPGAIPMKSVLLRPTRLVAVVFALVLMLALGALSLFTWLDFKRIESIRAHENRTSLLQESLVILKDLQLQAASNRGAPALESLQRARADLAQIPVKGGPVRSYTLERLDRLERLLTQAETQPGTALPPALALLSEMLERENRIQLEQLDTVYGYTKLESQLALAALLGFPCLVLLALWALRERVFRPIGDLKNFLSRLSNGDFAPVSLTRIDPLLLPLFQNYNQMVNRLEQLEQANRQRTMSLEQEVRAATQALLQQQQSLAGRSASRRQAKCPPRSLTNCAIRSPESRSPSRTCAASSTITLWRSAWIWSLPSCTGSRACSTGCCSSRVTCRKRHGW